MDEIKEATKDSALNDQTSTSGDETTSKTPQTYTEKTQRKAVSDALAEQGRVHKAALEPITQERDTLKTQAEQATTRLEDTNIRIKDLEKDLEEAIGEDADLRDIAKIKATLRTERDQSRLDVRAEREAVAELKRTTETERLEWAGTVAEAQAFKFDGELARLVDDYDGDTTANFNQLKADCDKAGIKTKDGAEVIAERSFTKKDNTVLVGDSGVTTGGGGGLTPKMVADMTPDQRFERQKEIDEMIKKNYS